MTVHRLSEAQALRRVYEVARRLVDCDEELAAAVLEADETLRFWAERRAHLFEARKVPCIVCGREFLPYDEGLVCSVGCQFSATGDVD